ncbi:MAG TPA: peptidoglycan-associated lipoprotein Pal [Usitatibacter sp.]|nr:peptidoglycan-associated lipoprotein Pal [Usitatibacter sp.]
MKKIALYAAIAVVAAACASKEAKEESTVADKSSNVPTTQAQTGTSNVKPAQPQQPVTGIPDQLLAKRSVYFDFDSNAVKDEYRGMIQAHSRFLADNRDKKARIEGNCDERGSREYNLALGQRRAEAVKKIMVVLGVADGRIETVSYGEEKPVAMGHDEAAWAQNRRADIKY